MALIYEPKVFADAPHVRAALTLRGRARLPYGNNMSLSVGDDEAMVRANRARLAARLGFSAARIALGRQVHGAAVARVDDDNATGESDALVSDREGWLLAVSVADCVPVLLFDRRRNVVAAVHSGWRGTLAGIATATIERMLREYGSEARDLLAYVGASAGQCCYEVGEEVAGAFDRRYGRAIGGAKVLFDNRGRVVDQLLESGMTSGSIELDERCTICSSDFHSYRRDGARSGRMFAVIGMGTGLQKVDALETA